MSYSPAPDPVFQGRSGSDRRAYHRFALPAGQLMAEVGAEGHHATHAQVQDISRGGVRLTVNEVAGWGGTTHCIVRFLDDTRRVRPAAIRGKIRRTGTDDGDCFVAIEFAEPLDELALSA